MKLQLIAISVTFALTACATTGVNDINNKKNDTKAVATATPVTLSAPKTVKAEKNQANEKKITLEQIMADPDWFGRAPESWYWGDDNQTVFYQQKRLGNPLRDLYRLHISDHNNGNTEQVNLAEMHVAADRYSVRNQAQSHEVYTFKAMFLLKT
jgi:hypothetical protein